MTGLFAAMIYVLTAWLHIPTGAGYTHAGDGLIYLAASMLPTPYAMAAGAIGAGLADGLSGFVVWLPGTIVIKAITALCFSRKTEKIICVRNLLGIIPALVICVVCYSFMRNLHGRRFLKERNNLGFRSDSCLLHTGACKLDTLYSAWTCF